MDIDAKMQEMAEAWHWLAGHGVIVTKFTPPWPTHKEEMAKHLDVDEYPRDTFYERLWDSFASRYL